MADKNSSLRIDIATLNGQKIRFAQTGPLDAKNAILVFNGIGANLETLDGFMSAFRGRRVISFDIPGVGGSPTPLIPYRFSQLSRLAMRLLAHLDVHTVDVFGVSWGGALAQQFAFENQPIVTSLTLAATSAGMVMVPGRLSVLSKLLTPKRYADPTFMTRIGPDLYGGLLRENEELLAEHLQAMNHSSLQGYVYQLFAISGWTSWPWLHRILCPTLVIMGEDDPIVPKVNGTLLCCRLPNARMVTMECGHLFLVTLPHETAGLVQQFISETTAFNT